MTTFHLERLTKRVKLVGSVETLTALHLGAGRETSSAGSDLPVILDALGNPFIPGSSLKGTLRAQAEAIARAIAEQRGEDAKKWSCDVVADEYCILKDNGKWDRKPAEILDEVCPICRLFGAPYLASRVYVHDLMVDPETWDPLLLQVRDGVAIDRESLTAADRKKFDLEVVPPGVRFKLEIVVENPQDYELGLLLWALNLFDQGYAHLGGASSRGTGRVRLILSDMEDLTIEELFAALEPFPESEAPQGADEEDASAEPSEEELYEQQIADPLDKLTGLLDNRGGSLSLTALKREGPSQYGFSKKRLKAFQIKDIDQLLQLAQERGLIRIEGNQITLAFQPSEEEDAPEAPSEPNRLEEYLRRYLPALQRWAQGQPPEGQARTEKPDPEEEGNSDV